MFKITTYLILSISLMLSGHVRGEDIYLDDKVMIGLHQDKSVDTPIIKLLPGGTKLELIKRDSPLSQVRDAEGTYGWIDNNYLTDTPPGRAQLQNALDKVATLEAEIVNLKTLPADISKPEEKQQASTLEKENEELKQLLKSERLRVGELQAQTADLKNKLGNRPDNSKITQQMQQLKQEKSDLEKRISSLQSGNNTEPGITINIGEPDWKILLIYAGVSLVIGILLGLYILDFVNRRRHGGFRI